MVLKPEFSDLTREYVLIDLCFFLSLLLRDGGSILCWRWGIDFGLDCGFLLLSLSFYEFSGELFGILFSILDLGISIGLELLKFKFFPVLSESIDGAESEFLLLFSEFSVLTHGVDADHELLERGFDWW